MALPSPLKVREMEMSFKLYNFMHDNGNYAYMTLKYKAMTIWFHAEVKEL